MSKLYLYRPHKYPWYGTMVRNFFLRRPQPKKYSHYMNKHTVFLLKRFPVNFVGFFEQIREFGEFFLWCILNKQSVFRGRILISSEAKLLVFGHRTIATESTRESDWREIRSEVKYISKLKCKKIIHLTHYFYGISQFIKNLHLIGAHILIGEGDPSVINSRVGREFESFEFQLVPFVSVKRFKTLVPYNERKHCAVSTGTVAPRIINDDFQYYFRTDCLQPDRLELYNLARENNLSACELFVENLYDKGSRLQRSYFKQDVVALYNSYKYYLVTCEIVGFPQIAMYEAVACGCVLISKDEKILSALGLVAGIHYILIDSFSKISEVITGRDNKIDIEMNSRCKEIMSKSTF